MIYRSLALLILGAATIAPSTLIPFARAFLRSTRIMPPATRLRRRRLSSLSPDAVTSVFLSKESNKVSSNKSKKLESSAVVPPTTASSSFVTSTSTPPTTTATTDDPHQYSTLLRSWANHTHADYHNFTEEEADGIRSALLEWYTNHRRKLPWRGDPPPFDGSTSGINSNSKSNNKKSRKSTPDDIDDDQKSITSFFSATSSRTKGKTGKDKITDSGGSSNSSKEIIKSEERPKKGEEESIQSEPLLDHAITVTGYGVWVSEIMLQQTRVEAVIPFWIRCK
jgi:hypothetical protein